MTVKIAGSTMTAKQKKCKHTYKVTCKATCQRVGIKTCTKCKWQKTTAKTDHKYINKTIVDYEHYEIVYYCMGCNCEDVPAGVCGDDYHYDTGTKCEHPCGFRVSTAEYGTVEACREAMSNHHCRNGYKYASTMEGSGDLVERTVKACKYCGKEK